MLQVCLCGGGLSPIRGPGGALARLRASIDQRPQRRPVDLGSGRASGPRRWPWRRWNKQLRNGGRARERGRMANPTRLAPEQRRSLRQDGYLGPCDPRLAPGQRAADRHQPRVRHRDGPAPRRGEDHRPGRVADHVQRPGPMALRNLQLLTRPPPGPDRGLWLRTAVAAPSAT